MLETTPILSLIADEYYRPDEPPTSGHGWSGVRLQSHPDEHGYRVEYYPPETYGLNGLAIDMYTGGRLINWGLPMSVMLTHLPVDKTTQPPAAAATGELFDESSFTQLDGEVLVRNRHNFELFDELSSRIYCLRGNITEAMISLGVSAALSDYVYESERGGVQTEDPLIPEMRLEDESHRTLSRRSSWDIVTKKGTYIVRLGANLEIRWGGVGEPDESFFDRDPMVFTSGKFASHPYELWSDMTMDGLLGFTALHRAVSRQLYH